MSCSGHKVFFQSYPMKLAKEFNENLLSSAKWKLATLNTKILEFLHCGPPIM